MFISIACSGETAYHVAAACVESKLCKMSEWDKYMIIDVVSYWLPEQTRDNGRSLVVILQCFISVAEKKTNKSQLATCSTHDGEQDVVTEVAR